MTKSRDPELPPGVADKYDLDACAWWDPETSSSIDDITQCRERGVEYLEGPIGRSTIRFCAPHAKLMRAQMAVAEMGKALVPAVHEWAQGRLTDDELRRRAFEHLEGRALLRRAKRIR